ncbi:MAG: transcriptional regulator NrdR [Nanoarchaeota archaeon]
MKCPYCNYSDSKVIDSRESEAVTRRRRECLNCKKRFTTYERIEFAPLYVIKKDGSREEFNREKLKKGIIKACEKRPIAIEKINAMIDKIEAKLKSLKSTEIKSKVIGEEVMKALQRLDKVAYIRFASVYREFADLGEFEKEIKLLKK